jgi:hypothetical protein
MDAARTEVFALMRRYNEIGSRLPAEGDIDFDRDKVRLLLAEMRVVQRSIDRLLKP